MTIDISSISGRDSAECYILVYDSDMNHLGTIKPTKPAPVLAPPPVLAPAPVVAGPFDYAVSAEFTDGKIIVTTKPEATCLVSIIGLTGLTTERKFTVPDYQVKEGKTFTVIATWLVNGKWLERVVTVGVAGEPAPVEEPTVEEPTVEEPVINEPTIVSSIPTQTAECVGNRHIFNPVIEWRGGKARIVAKDAPNGVFYWVSGGVPTRELETDYLYDPGDQVTIYAALTDNPDVFYGTFQPSYSVITIPTTHDTQQA